MTISTVNVFEMIDIYKQYTKGSGICVKLKDSGGQSHFTKSAIAYSRERIMKHFLFSIFSYSCNACTELELPLKISTAPTIVPR